MSGASTNEVTILAALIGVAGSIGASLLTTYLHPRKAPQMEDRTPPPQQTATRPDGTYWPVQPDQGQITIAPPAQRASSAGKLKISRSLWWGIAGCVCFAVFALAWGCALVGIFIAVRDIRSPGTRRLAWWGLIICALALVIAAANPHSGFMTGFHQGFDQSS